MTQTERVRRHPSNFDRRGPYSQVLPRAVRSFALGSVAPCAVALCSVALGLVALTGCTQDGDGGLPAGTGGFTQESEQSPNARILPEPLEGSRKRKAPGATQEPAIASEKPLARAKARPWEVQREPAADDLRRGTGAGYKAALKFRFAESKASAELRDETLPLWPQMIVELLKERPDQSARLRLILDSDTFYYPRGTELRFRADRLGSMILWPDQRSYRLVPEGALRSVFLDRRVDRTPYVDAQLQEEGAGTHLGQPTRAFALTSAVGVVKMQSVTLADLPYGGQLLCAALLQLCRMRATAEICPEGQLPVSFQVTWPTEASLNVEMTGYEPALELSLDQFRAPPDLPIFKHGELPPSMEYFFDEEKRFALFPLTHKKGASTLQAPAPAITSPPGVAAPPPVPAEPGPPQNELRLHNSSDRPLVVFLERMPFRRLAPDETVVVYLSVPEVRVSAHDFLREAVYPEAKVKTPTVARFGPALDALPANSGAISAGLSMPVSIVAPSNPPSSAPPSSKPAPNAPLPGASPPGSSAPSAPAP